MPETYTRLGRWHWDDYGVEASPGEPAIVLLHGLMLDRRMWAGQVGILQSVGRVLAFDGPGHGLSEIPPPFTLEEQADALAEALDFAAVQRAVLVGHGWGGLVALRFALRHPTRTAGLALVSATADRELPRRRRSRRTLLRRLSKFGAPRWFLRARIARLVYGAQALRERPDLAAAMSGTVNDHPREGLFRAAEAVLDRSSVAARLEKVWAPTLVICGERDRTLAPSHSEKLARRIPGARLVRIDAGHTPPVERPEVTRAALLPFVCECVARPLPAQPPAGGGLRNALPPQRLLMPSSRGGW